MADKLPLDPNIATVLGNLEFMDADGKPEKDQKAQQALLVETIKAEAARNLAGQQSRHHRRHGQRRSCQSGRHAHRRLGYG